MKRIRVWVDGKVQGVSFRYYTQRKAMEMGVSGWVENLPDGSVYLEAEAEEERLKQLIDWLNQGPPRAQVVKIEIKDTLPRYSHGFYIH